MKTLWKVLIAILAVFIVSLIVFQVIINNQICYDKGGSKTYFLKDYYLDNPSLFFNKTFFDIPSEVAVARYSESARCGDRGTYSVFVEGKFKKVSKVEFDEFISSYEEGDLLVNINRWGPSGIYDVSSGKEVCSVVRVFQEAPIMVNCVNVTR